VGVGGWWVGGWVGGGGGFGCACARGGCERASVGVCVRVVTVRADSNPFTFTLIPENHGRGTYCPLHCTHIAASREDE
jgi:hypothetical protein